MAMFFYGKIDLKTALTLSLLLSTQNPFLPSNQMAFLSSSRLLPYLKPVAIRFEALANPLISLRLPRLHALNLSPFLVIGCFFSSPR